MRKNQAQLRKKDNLLVLETQVDGTRRSSSSFAKIDNFFVGTLPIVAVRRSEKTLKSVIILLVMQGCGINTGVVMEAPSSLARLLENQ